jgi:hypothetical protein
MASKHLGFDDIWASIPKRARYNIFDANGRSLGDLFATSEEDAVKRSRERGFPAVRASR